MKTKASRMLLVTYFTSYVQYAGSSSGNRYKSITIERIFSIYKNAIIISYYLYMMVQYLWILTLLIFFIIGLIC